MDAKVEWNTGKTIILPKHSPVVRPRDHFHTFHSSTTSIHGISSKSCIVLYCICILKILTKTVYKVEQDSHPASSPQNPPRNIFTPTRGDFH